MSRKKNLLDYLALTLFIMCMGLALSASLEYVTRATEREYLGQGIWVLSMAGLSLLALLLGRISRKCGQKMQPLPKNIVMIALGAVLVGVGVYLRLWVIWNIPVEPDSDFETYYRMANHLLNDTLMSAEGAVDRRYIALYPHTIGFPMLILLAGHIARRIAGRTGALVAVALMSLWPSHILFSNMVATEPSFTMLILLAADMMTSILDRRKGSLYDVAPSRMLGVMALLGIVLALAGAIRPMAVILLAAYCVVQLCVTGDPMNEIRVEGARYATSQPIVCIVLVLVCYLVTGSVISRAISDIIGEQPASGLYASGYNLMVGLNTQSNGLWNETDSEFFAQAYDATKSATGAHQACMEVAAQRIQSEPENVLNLMVYKFRDLWRTDDFGIDWNLLWTEQQGTLTPELRSLLESIRPVGRVMYMVVLLFAALGAMEAWRRRLAPNAMILICMLFFLGTALSHMLLETQVRYHYNMIPFLILLAAWTVRSWSKTAAEKEDVRVIYVDRPENAEEKKDNIHFDMAKAIAEGHIHVSVTENVARTEEASKMEDSAKSSVENT